MNFKKVLSLSLAGILSLCVSTASFASEPTLNEHISNTPEITAEESLSNPTPEEIKLMEEFEGSNSEYNLRAGRGVYDYAVNLGSSISTFLNARSGPGTNYGVKYKLSHKTPIVVAEIRNGWARCVGYQYSMRTGMAGTESNFYVSAKYLSRLSNGQVYKEYLTTANLNVRTGASTNNSVLHTLSKGSGVAGFNTSNGFRLVWSGAHKATGYSSNQYLKFNRNVTIS